MVEGTAVFSHAGRPCLLDYRVVCDPAWRTVSGRVAGWQGTELVDIAIGVDHSRQWMVNGRPCPQVRGCDDIDLSFSPATNLLPIRRTGLEVGARARFPVAWLRFPAMTLESLDQSYERVSASQYRFESGGGSFAALLETTTSGVVTNYPGLWQLEAIGQ